MSDKTTTVFAIGRWMPIHLGHKNFLVNLARTYDRLVIGIGSCYENGTPRNCIPAVEREKLLRKMLASEGITNAVIIPVQDRETFDEWINDVICVFRKYDVTHFCTGNKEDILDVLESKGIGLNVEMINPEEASNFPYHATDIRNAILNGEFDRLDSMIPSEIKPMVTDQIAREIRLANAGEGQEFIPGRQTADLILTVNNVSDGHTYLLIGKRNSEKVDFPDTWAIPGSGIEEFESPVSAAIRSFYSETGIKATVVCNCDEPAEITLDNIDGQKTALHFVGIYASHDTKINGTRGGASQCFAVNISGDINRISEILHSSHDMVELKFVNVDDLHGITLAFDQKTMVYDALNRFGIAFDNGELLETFDEEGNALNKGISRTLAHSEGILHGASHTYICKKENGEILFLLQRRSYGKDSYPGCLDISSAGHIEAGSDFISTAQKELAEELGIDSTPDDFTELFTQSVDLRSEFRGKEFIDREINKIYLYKGCPDISSLKLQQLEVCEAVWLSSAEILDMLERKDKSICLNPDEFRRVLDEVSKRNI